MVMMMYEIEEMSRDAEPIYLVYRPNHCHACIYQLNIPSHGIPSLTPLQPPRCDVNRGRMLSDIYKGFNRGNEVLTDSGPDIHAENVLMVRCSAAEYNCSHYLHNILRESPGGPAEQGRAQ